MWFPAWLRWYKKPEYRDIKQYATEVKLGQRSISPDGRNRGLIPPHLSLDKVLANKTCSPMSLYDFYMYLKHIEYSPENLEFYLWFKNYEASWYRRLGQGESGYHKSENAFVHMSQSNSSEEDLKTEQKLAAERLSDVETAAEATAQILQSVIPPSACAILERPKPCARDRLKSFANTFMSSTNASCGTATIGDFGVPGAHESDEALEAIIRLYLLPSSPKELNIPPSMRDAALEALKNSSSKDPSCLRPIADHVFGLLRTCSHPNFLRLGVANGTLETVCVATSLGIVLTIVGFIFVFVRGFVPYTGAHSRWELFGAWGFWFLGISLVLSGVRGSCFFLLLFSRRQPLPWERFDDKASITSNRSGVAKILGRLMIFDRKLRVKDINLRQLQRKIVIQSLIGGAVFASLGIRIAMAPKRIDTEAADASPLGKPLEFAFSGKTAKNRFLKAAMTERLSTWDAQDLKKRGVPTPELINAYRRWGEGEFGLILTGNVMIEYDQLEAAGNPIIPREAPLEGERFEAFKEMAAAGKKHGSLMVAQLSHPGRQVGEHIQSHPISASDIQLEGNIMGMTFAKPRAMEKADFEAVIEGFAHAAEYTYKAGYDGVQLHGAHGYLLAQFLSQTTNKRTDEYGGSLSNRARLIFQISDAIRARVPDRAFIIGIKVNSVEFQQGGFSPDDCRELCGELEQHGFDFVELSGGTYQETAFQHKRESTKKREAFFLEFADSIVKELSKTKAYVTGGLRTVKGMVGALSTVDGVGLARPITHEFDLPAKILRGEVQSSIDLLLDEQDFGQTNVAAGTQIRLVANDKEPLDLSRKDHKNIFDESVGKWSEQMAQNKDNSKFGYVDILGVKLEPFGTAYGQA
ncbi:NADH-dependent flavin oxidoreductase nadA [Paramyrothecium foliicola]|nr:NADH-dependent flavin oxidoreductase nadA [Paramyrothecium foliicola]